MKCQVIIQLLLLICQLSHTVFGCNHRDYGNGATVCVCSEALGCDNLASVNQLSTTKGSLTIFVTSKAGARFQRQELNFTSSSVASEANETLVEIDRTKRYQKILGFGGAFTDSAGMMISSLPKKLQERLIRDYFADDGLEYRINRVPIGACDYSPRPYSYCDKADANHTLTNFALQQEDLLYKIPYMQMAKQVSSHNVTFFGSIWSPPAWMKTNNKLNLGGAILGQPGGHYYEQFAQYMVRFLQEYQRHQVPMWGLTVENEPTMGHDDYINLCLDLKDWMERDYVKLNLGPALHKAGFGDVQVMMNDDGMPILVQRTGVVLGDPEANKYISGVAYHWYFNINNYGVLEEAAKKHPDKFFLSTESCEFVNGWKHGSWYGNWTSFDHYVLDILNNFLHSSNGFVDWNLALNPDGGPSWCWAQLNAAIIVNTTSQEYFKQPFFYGLGHFSKLLPPESVRIESVVQKGAQKGVLMAAFERPDKSIVLNVLNTDSEPIQMRLHDPERGYATVQLNANSLESVIWY